MGQQDSEIRKKVASLARSLYAGKITFMEFIRQAPDTEDGEVAELVDLIEHEPKKGGFLGVDAKTHEDYRKAIFALIDKLEQ